RTAIRRGRGIACTVYHDTYVAQVAEVEVSLSGAVRLIKVWCVVDPGQTVNPEGVRNQIEGGIQQSASWTLKEELLHRDGRVMNTGWDTYPIATFRDAPESIEVLVEGDESAPPTGVGEPGAVPTAAAISYAVFCLKKKSFDIVQTAHPTKPGQPSFPAAQDCRSVMLL